MNDKIIGTVVVIHLKAINQNQVKQICTLRAKNNGMTNGSIHGTPVSNFANANKIKCGTVPPELKRGHNKYFEYSELKKAVNS